MVFLLDKKAVEENRTPDSKIRSPAFRLFGAVGARNPVGPVATVFPEFIARGQRSARTGAVKETSAGWVRPAGAAEDTALRALTAYGSGLRSLTR